MMVDIAIVIDATGSMRTRLPQLMAQFIAMLTGAASLVTKVSTELSVELQLRCALLGFRDRDDNREQFELRCSAKEDVFFGPDPQEIAELVGHTQALKGKGGDDTCEDVPAALRKATEWDEWTGAGPLLAPRYRRSVPRLRLQQW